MHFIHPKIRLCEYLDLLREVTSEAYGEPSRISFIGHLCEKRSKTLNHRCSTGF